jgi:hypothetical protein
MNWLGSLRARILLASTLDGVSSMREKKGVRYGSMTKLPLALLCVLFLVLALPDAQGGAWITKTSPPSPGYGGFGEAVVGTGDSVYVIRCHDRGSCQFWRYNASSDGWTTILTWTPDDPIPRLKSGTALAWDSSHYMYALLGAAYEDKGTSARYYFYRYDTSTNLWIQLTNTTHAQGAGNAIAWSGYDNTVYAMLGSIEHGTSFARYHFSSNTWETLSFNPSWTVTDDGASLVWTGGEYLYALRGEWDETLPHNDFARYHITTGTWENMNPIPESGGVGDGASLLWTGEYSDYVFALGGNNATESPGYGFYRYSISGNSWTVLDQLPYPVGYYVGNRLAFARRHIYYWQGAPSTWDGGNAFYMYSMDATTTTTQQQTSTTTAQQTTTTSQQVTTSVTSAVTTTATTTTTTSQPIPPPSGMGFAFAVIGIGAGAAAVGVGVAVAASGPLGSGVYTYGGYYYCRQHRVPVWSVRGGLWCPVEQRYVRP